MHVYEDLGDTGSRRPAVGDSRLPGVSVIIQCAACKTRFKIGDDKVTEAGVKVRCTKCGAVFVARKQAPVGLPGESVPASPGPGAPPASQPDLEKLLAGFSAPAAKEPGPAASGRAPAAEGARIVSALASMGDARPPAPSPRGRTTPAPVGPIATPAIAPHEAVTFEDPLAGLDLDARPTIEPTRPMLPATGPLAAAPLSASAMGEEAGLEMDLAFDPDSFTPTVVSHAMPPEPSLPPAPAALAPEAGRPPVAVPVAVATAPPAAASAQPANSPPHAAPEGRSLLSMLAAGAAFAAVVALLVFAFIAWRGRGLDVHDPMRSLASALHPARAARGGGWGVRVTGSGYYPTAGGEPLVFVAGEVTNAGPAARPLQVEVEIRNAAGQMVAAGRGWPGREPGPEDLWNVRDAADLAALERRLAQAPDPLPPRGHAGFLVALVRPPGDDDDWRIHVRAAPVLGVGQRR